MESLEFSIVDVFTDSPLAGNQLAVFLDAEDLSSDEMLALAREMGYSETTFLMSRQEVEGGYPVRIFTPREEVPFAGHPTLGTAAVINERVARGAQERIVLNLKSGPIPVDISYRDGQADVLWMRQANPVFGAKLDAAELVSVLGIREEDLDERFPICEASTGLPFIIVPVKTLAALRNIKVSREHHDELIARTEAKAILAFTRETYSPSNDLNVRVFADYYGTPEDPATGSANGSLAGYLVKYRVLDRDSIDISVEQGYEISRPSQLLLRATERGDGIDVRVGGRVQPVARGVTNSMHGGRSPQPRASSTSGVSSKLRPFGSTIFTEMTVLANEHGAINLGQGFPNFEGPARTIDAAISALRSENNQYSPSQGHLALRREIAAHQRHMYGLDYDPDREVTVFCGATEGLASSMLGLLEPGDEVIFLEPFYDSYRACAALAGAEVRFVTLRPPGFRIEPEMLERAFSPRTRMLLLNSPHNPSGRVFSDEELEWIASQCIEHDAFVISDEVYEHITYDGHRHRPIATLPGMRDRTLTISSSGKTFSMTGWKIGWATGPSHLVGGAQAAHQYITFCAASPLQLAVADALEHGIRRGDYADELKRAYAERRTCLVAALRTAGFEVFEPEGTYFMVASIEGLSSRDDRAFVRELVEEHGVAAVPMSVFYRPGSQEGRSLVRFAFCKDLATLQAAGERLATLRGRAKREPKGAE